MATRIHWPTRIKSSFKVIGYFSYTLDHTVLCDGDACIIAGSAERMEFYLQRLSKNKSGKDIIKKTRFGEIMEGLRQGGAYAFDEEAYARFSHHAKDNNIKIPSGAEEEFFADSPVTLHFIRIQMIR